MSYSPDEAFKLIEPRIDSMQNTLVECMELIYNVAYNEAIEEAAKVANENGEGCCWNISEEIRKLKK